MSKQPPPAPTASAVGPCPTVIHTGSLPSTIAPPDHPLKCLVYNETRIINRIDRLQYYFSQGLAEYYYMNLDGSLQDKLKGIFLVDNHSRASHRLLAFVCICHTYTSQAQQSLQVDGILVEVELVEEDPA